MNTHTLTRHRDIQSWVADRKGQPAIRHVPDRFGQVKARLTLSFQKAKKPSPSLSVDDGMSPCSWAAWLAELDRQHLALKVSDSADFEFVDRKELN